MILHFSLCWISCPLRLTDGKPDERGVSHPLTALHPPGLPLAPQGPPAHLNPQGSPGASFHPPGFPNAAQQEPEEGSPGPVLPLPALLPLHGTPQRPLASFANLTPASHKLIRVPSSKLFSPAPLIWTWATKCWPSAETMMTPSSWPFQSKGFLPPLTHLAFLWEALTLEAEGETDNVVQATVITSPFLCPEKYLIFVDRKICPCWKGNFLHYQRNIFVLRPVKSEFCIQRNIQTCLHLDRSFSFDKKDQSFLFLFYMLA